MIYTDKMKKKDEKLIKGIIEEEKRIKKIIAEKYNGDEDAYCKDTFDMINASLWTGLGFDTIWKILREKLPADSPRIKMLDEAEKSKDFDTHNMYPGGYPAFVEDVKNGYFKGIHDVPYEL